MKRVFFFLALSTLFLGISASTFACGERCQVNDPRSECNAYGAPDKYKDANIVTTSGDASAD